MFNGTDNNLPFFESVLNNIYLITLVSLIIIFLQNGKIDGDGVLYITQAKLISNGDYSQALELYNWPFFSILIAFLHKFTGFSIFYNAHFIDLSLFVIASFFYLKNIEFISKSKINPFFGTVVLLTSIPLMDDYVGMILRDHGQWACFMMGMYFYLLWHDKPNFLLGFLWQFSFILGTLFRPECFLLNVFIPIVQIFLIRNFSKIKLFLQSTSLLFFCLILFLISIYFFKFEIVNINFGRFFEIFSRAKDFFVNLKSPLPIDSENFFLKIILLDYSIIFKYMFLSYVAIYKWISGVGLLHILFILIAFFKKTINRESLKILCMFFLITFLTTLINFYTTFVLSGRYWLMNWWVVYIFATFGFAQIWTLLKFNVNPKKILFKNILILILSIYFLNVLIDKPKKHEGQEAAEWIKNNNIKLNDVYFNDRRTAFYAGLIGFDLLDTRKAIEDPNVKYLIINYYRFSKIESISDFYPIQYFPDIGKPKIIVYERLNY